LSKEEQERLMAHFVSVSTARCVRELVNVNKNAAAYFFSLREIICQASEETPFFYVSSWWGSRFAFWFTALLLKFRNCLLFNACLLRVIFENEKPAGTHMSILYRES
jgi:hypothetical protein